MNSPLLCVDLVLRNQDETFPGLQDVGSTIADFLGPGRSLSLHEACTSGSTKLLNWIWRSGSSSSFSEALEVAVARGDLETVKWLFEHFKHCQVAVEVVEAAAWNGQLEILQYLLEHDAGVKSESMGRDVFGSAVAMKDLVRSGRLDLMKRIAAQHEPPPEDSGWTTDWRCAMWLMQHPAGRWTCDGDDRLYAEFVFSAAYKGNVEVMEYLFERGTVDKVRDALLHAIREGHLDLVKWLIEHFPESERIPEYCVLDEAASRQSLLASDDYLKVHQTLCRYRTEWHPTEAMDDAAANGHLEVVKWLHLNRSEGCTTSAMDCAAANGHLDVVQWIHTHRTEGCTTQAMDGAAENGHLDVIKWLHRNRFEGCTRKAIEGALSNGYLRVADWLHIHLPQLIPANVELWRCPRDLFELLLFQSFHFSSTLSSSLAHDFAPSSSSDSDSDYAPGSNKNKKKMKKTTKQEETKQEEEEETKEETGPKFYSPWDVTETASGLLVPSYVLTQLLPYQRECLEWLHKLHERGVGGILGDDMGLGKTVQLASFLGSLHRARRLRTVLLLCPASVLLQWVRELHKWVPWMRVVLLHASGTGVNTSFSNGEAEDAGYPGMRDDASTGGGVVISTYENVRQYQSLFLTREWDYVVLDEGHRIRNPDAETTLACKQLRTVHRIILSGTPIQNRLRRLGTLPTFDDEFVLPIRAGGYATATKMQVLMAYKCALALKDLIEPFLLRRTKQEVLMNGASGSMGALLPGKREQILFCRLTKRQRALYKRFLASPEVASVLRRDIRPFRAISVLRHICNHPDLLASFGDGKLADKKRQTYDEEDEEEDEDKEEGDELFGAASASGKMVVLQKVLALWKEQGHRVLIFTQTRGMLDILESFMSRLGHACCRLDGTTAVAERQQRLDAFNDPDSELFAFLLTTRAGGIGVNLVGADRVVVFDPDWNPSTDVQARERAWRIGQQKPVTVYRLVTAGTIEEKIYHRQIFKQYLTSKVLHDAKRKRCFNKHSLRDLFVLTDEKDEEDGVAETNELFVAGNVERPTELEDGEEKEADNGDTPQSEESKTNTDAGDNDAVLQQLFDGGDVRGVFDHSAVESDGVQNQEADLVEMEATKIAQGALSALRASGALVLQQRETIYTPTWTGRSGAAGDPSQRRQQPAVRGHGNRRDGVAARATQAQPQTRAAAAASCQSPLSASEMAKRLHAFLVANAAGVTTERLLENFGNVVAPKDKLVFRHVLRDMA
uniref:DNA excision repair protein n=1 Tax=Phytophthora ramorum TaxID=164328 RepID=H3HD47_PHYRM